MQPYRKLGRHLVSVPKFIGTLRVTTLIIFIKSKAGFQVIELFFVKFNADKNFSSGSNTTARNRKGSCNYFLLGFCFRYVGCHLVLLARYTHALYIDM